MMTEHVYGDEIEVHSLLVIDQNTFEGQSFQGLSILFHKFKRFVLEVTRFMVIKLIFQGLEAKELPNCIRNVSHKHLLHVSL